MSLALVCIRASRERMSTRLFVFDAGYDAARLSRKLAGRYQQLLIQLNFRCCFYAEPPEVPPPG